MTKLLEQAIAQLKTLSEEEQDTIASLILAEMEIDSSTLGKRLPIKRGKTGRNLLQLAGTWRGDDLEECLEVVRGDRSQAQF
ncbi:MAG: hypothetical protein HC916_05085 [Coleofasciculaceae cyanobacterium SM2_1_6]|nr:hypothetical protein [Coleofasciculaceae cyanobacterium SM2_1_6]